MALVPMDETAARKRIRGQLDAFVSAVPPYGAGEIQSGTPVLPKSEMTPDAMIAARANNATDPVFSRLTERTHLGLLELWNSGVPVTTCNEFVGHYGRAVGANINLGQFPIESVLAGAGKAHAWVNSASGETPQYGDIFRERARHMAVSYDVVGGGWWTVESGQGGPTKGCDIIKSKIRFFHPEKLRGWIDMEVFLDPRPAVPDWLIGSWKINGYGQPYYYMFDRRYRVAWSTSLAGLAAPNEVADLSLSPISATVTWRSGTKETFTSTPFSMAGVSFAPGAAIPSPLICFPAGGFLGY